MTVIRSARLARLGILLGAAFLAAGCRRSAPPEKPRDNVVLVVIDTVRQDHLAAYGYGRETAPFLSGLARRGVVLDALAPSSWTKPSTASLLTGLHPLRHQTFGRRDRLPAAAVPLAEILRRGGYQTLAASANGWISPTFGFDRGFTTFLLAENVAAVELNRELLPRLDGLRPPFFLYVHYIDPHLPYEPRMAWDGGPVPAALKSPLTLQEADATHFVARPRRLLEQARDLYDGEIRSVDGEVAALMDRLDARGLLRNTVVVVTSDHGEELAEHGRMSHGQSLYQEVVQVPLIISAPRRFPAGRRPGSVSLLDIVPTLADLLGLQVPAGSLDGVSFADRLTAARPRPAASRPFLLHLDFTDGVGLALIDGRDKLVLGKRPYRKELFDLAADPGERENGLGKPGAAATAARLGTEMADLFNAYARAAHARATVSIEDELMKRLVGLGYIAGRAEPAERRIPRRVSPPDPFPEGRLGWAEGEPTACLRLAERDAEPHLLAGWYDAEAGGRWTARSASLGLAPPEAREPSALVIRGDNFRPAPVGLRVSVDRRLVLQAAVPPGTFRLAAPLGGPLAGPMLIEIGVDRTFVPDPSGAGDARSLGIFVADVCVLPEAGTELGAGSVQ